MFSELTGPARKVDVLKTLECLCWFLLPPSRLKNAILRRFGHQISTTARIGPTLVFGVRRFEIGENVQVLPFNVIKGLSLTRLDDSRLVIASWNWISAATEFQQIDPQAGTLACIEYAGKLGSRNYVDCSGTVIMQAILLRRRQSDLSDRRTSPTSNANGKRQVGL